MLKVDWNSIQFKLLFKIFASGFIYGGISTFLNFFIKWQVAYSSFKFPGLVLGLQFLITSFIINFMIAITNKLNITQYQLFHWKTFTHYSIIGLLVALDYAISNSSLSYISVSYYVVAKSTSPIFTLVVGFLTRMERLSVLLIISVILISSGVSLTSIYIDGFDWLGLLYLVISNVFMAVRMFYIQYMLQHGSVTSDTSAITGDNSMTIVISEALNFDSDEEVHSKKFNDDMELATYGNEALSVDSSENDSIDGTLESNNIQPESKSRTLVDDEDEVDFSDSRHKLITSEALKPSWHNTEPASLKAVRNIMPVGGLVCMIFVYFFESPKLINAFETLPLQSILKDAIINIVVVVTLGFVLNISEFFLIELSSTMTAIVVGILKQFAVITIAYLFTDEKFNFLSLCGFFITMTGVIIYNVHRYRQQARRRMQSLEHAAESVDEEILKKYSYNQPKKHDKNI